MKSILLIVTFIACFFAVRSQDHWTTLEKKEKRENKVVYWTFGYGNEFEKEYALEKAANKYGFSFNHVTGCIVTKKIISRIAGHNKTISKLISKKLGRDWLSVIYSKADSIYQIDTFLIHHFYEYHYDNPTFGMKFFNRVDTSYEYRRIYVTPTEKADTYILNVVFPGKDWMFTKKPFLVVEATYPGIAYREILNQ